MAVFGLTRPAALTVMSFAFDRGRIVLVHAVRNPEKLAHVRLA